MTLIRSIYRITVLLLCCTLLVMCSDSPTTVIIIPNNDDKPTYTIMYYAVGGATLDEAIEESVERAEKIAATNVRMTGCIKWTKGYASGLSNGEGEVIRFVSQGKSETEIEKIGDNNWAMSEPEHIAEFLEWSREVAPADHYILVVAGHGNGWSPSADGTRGTLRDTDLGQYTTIEELCEGIERGGTTFRMIQMISCSANTMEYITPLSQYADYILASSHISVMLSSELAFLKNELKDIKSDVDFEKSLSHYLNDINSDIKSNEAAKSETLDFILTECKSFAALNEAIADFTKALVEVYESEDKDVITTLEESIAKAYYLSQEALIPEEEERRAYTYDIVDIARCAAKGCEALAEYAEAIERRAEEARVKHCIRNLPAEVSEVYYGVTLTNAEKWAERGYEAAGYEQTLFNRETQWAEFLKRNNAEIRY